MNFKYHLKNLALSTYRIDADTIAQKVKPVRYILPHSKQSDIRVETGSSTLVIVIFHHCRVYVIVDPTLELLDRTILSQVV